MRDAAGLWREVVRVGTWLYAQEVERRVRIIRQNFDPQHEAEYDDHSPTLNAAGESYTVAFGDLRDGWWFQEERATETSEQAAVAKAEELAGRISWYPRQPPERLAGGAK
jgi:hypothetical protein